ncbi:MAG: hypothetical protein MUO26_10570 [Methanotrichaceae archaeon]|nr:hypothetical protein [Methanotrichaceae archaeon]
MTCSSGARKTIMRNNRSDHTTGSLDTTRIKRKSSLSIRLYSANGFQLLDDGTSSPAMEYVDLGQYIKPEMPRIKRKLGYVQDLRKRAVS